MIVWLNVVSKKGDAVVGRTMECIGGYVGWVYVLYRRMLWSLCTQQCWPCTTPAKHKIENWTQVWKLRSTSTRRLHESSKLDIYAAMTKDLNFLIISTPLRDDIYPLTDHRWKQIITITNSAGLDVIFDRLEVDEYDNSSLLSGITVCHLHASFLFIFPEKKTRSLKWQIVTPLSAVADDWLLIGLWPTDHPRGTRMSNSVDTPRPHTQIHSAWGMHLWHSCACKIELTSCFANKLPIRVEPRARGQMDTTSLCDVMRAGLDRNGATRRRLSWRLVRVWIRVCSERIRFSNLATAINNAHTNTLGR